MRNTPVFTGLAAAALLGMTGFAAGCADETVPNPTQEDPTVSETSITTLGLRFDVVGDTETACGEAAGVRVAIQREGAPDSRQECTAMWADAYVSDPYTGVEDDGDHHVADCFFVVDPGIYDVPVLEVVGTDGEALDCCTASFATKMTIMEGDTTEIGAELRCDVIGSGGLDIYGYLNRPPILTNVTISPSKFGPPCPPITLEATAQDPEGDDVSFDWVVVTAPDGAEYNLDENGSTAVFTAATVGDYEIRVTVTDGPHNTSTSLTFPIHIVGDPVGECVIESRLAALQTQLVDTADPLAAGATVEYHAVLFNENDSGEALAEIGAEFHFGAALVTPPLPGIFVPASVTVWLDDTPEVDGTGAVSTSTTDGTELTAGVDYTVVATSTGMQILQFDPGFELAVGSALYVQHEVTIPATAVTDDYDTSVLWSATGVDSDESYSALSSESTTVDAGVNGD